MADDQDDASKTEDPSAKKLSEAHKKGDIPKSQELKHWFMLIAFALVVITSSTTIVTDLLRVLRTFLEQSAQLSVDSEGFQVLILNLIDTVALILAFPIGILVLFAIAGSILQSIPVLSAEKIKPKLNKISPIGGFKKLVSMNQLVEFSKTIFKLVIMVAVAYVAVWPEKEKIPQMVAFPIPQVLPFVKIMTLRIVGGVIAAMTIIAALDFIWQKFQHTKKLKMTKQEVKDEYKQIEGDPHVKARLRQLRQERSRQRMLAAVPEADVVITNPTHYAIVLKYDQGDMEVPVVVAKGLDFLAEKIRDAANENDVPIIQNPPLARTIYATVEVDDEIHPDQYRAVASVISYVMKLNKTKPKKPKNKEKQKSKNSPTEI